MIDWSSVFFNSLWIAGLALILAAVSYYYWVAAEESLSVRTMFQQPAFTRFVYLGLMLVGIGLIGTSSSAIETALAVGLIALCAYGLFGLYQRTKENHS